MEPIKILYINGGIMDRGGISMYMMNYFRNLDRNKVQIDFVVHGYQKGDFDDEIIKFGSKIYNIPLKRDNYFENIKQLRNIFKCGEYKIVHSHMDAMGAIVLREAKKCGIPIRIAHSHSTKHLTNNKLKYLFNEYIKKKIVKYATHRFACSYDAGIWLFGDKYKNETIIIRNAVDINKFCYDEKKQQKKNHIFNFEKKIVLGHIGHFNFIKNHNFLIDVFEEISFLRDDVVLLLIGDGSEKNNIHKKVKEKKLEDKVYFMGTQNNVHEYMDIMDCIIFPSLFEGLPIVIIEAQAKSLNCFVSDTVTKDVKITENVSFLSLDKGAKYWAEIINPTLNLHKKRNTIEDLTIAGYNIEVEAKKLEQLYIKIYSEEKKYENIVVS